jgi:hypothetical protein
MALSWSYRAVLTDPVDRRAQTSVCLQADLRSADAEIIENFRGTVFAA